MTINLNEITIKVGFEIETIFPFKDKLFIGSTSVVHIFSITDPAKPAKLSQAISPTVLRRCDPVVAKDNVAYATLRVNGACGGVQSILAHDELDVTQQFRARRIDRERGFIHLRGDRRRVDR